MHKLAIHPKFQGNGYSKEMMATAEEYACRNNYDCIRMDVYSGNPITIKLYEKRDYLKTGVATDLTPIFGPVFKLVSSHL